MTPEKSIYPVDTHNDAGASNNENTEIKVKENNPITAYTKQLTIAIGLLLSGMGLSSCDKIYEDVQPRKPKNWDLINKGTILKAVDVDTSIYNPDSLKIVKPVIVPRNGAI